ncbi:MAG: hypothetical protein EXR62_11670 [Chloroflexi bacterium]|nr:hypothetical protein [Chloroflexota bacterium]
MTATKLHLDTDLGGDIDDLCALAMLLKWPDLDITCITTVAEEHGRRAGYVKYILQLAERQDIPLAAGADVSLGCYRDKPGYPEERDYWPEPIAPAYNPLDDALDLLKKSIEQGAILVAIGPYTNLALLERKYPGILAGAQIYLMGGYIYPVRDGFPQWGNDMDYNIQLDVPSAKQVIETCHPTLLPLSVTVETALRRAHLPGLRASGPIGEIIARQAEAFAQFFKNEEQYGKTCAGLPDDIINFQHDPLACAVALGWDGVAFEKVPLKVEIEDGWLYERIDPMGKPTRIVTRVDGNKFNGFWYNVVTGLKM